MDTGCVLERGTADKIRIWPIHQVEKRRWLVGLDLPSDTRSALTLGRGVRLHDAKSTHGRRRTRMRCAQFGVCENGHIYETRALAEWSNRFGTHPFL